MKQQTNFGRKFTIDDSRPYRTHVKKKICSKCKAEKPIDEFTKRPEAMDGYNTRCSVCLNEYQTKLRDERRRYEIHFNGQKLESNSLEDLKKVSVKIPEPCVIYEIRQSKMNDEKTATRERLPKEEKTKPKIYDPILTYKEVVRASHALNANKVSRTMIAKSLYCSLQKLNKSLLWFDATGSQEEYEAYDPTKINSHNSKTLLHS